MAPRPRCLTASPRSSRCRFSSRHWTARFAAIEWIAELDAELIAHTPTWERMREHSPRAVAEYAERIVEALSAEDPPELGID